MPDNEAMDAYAALVSIVHQMTRLEAGLGMPTALDEIERFLKSFEVYVDTLDQLDPVRLEAQYEILRRSTLDEANAPNLRFGALALIVIILGEMIRRDSAKAGEPSMSGYDCALRMLNRFEHLHLSR